MKLPLKVPGMIALCLALAAGSGCAFAPARYDPVEQLGYAALWQQAKRLEEACPNGDRAALQAGILRELAELVAVYASHQADAGSREIADAYTRLLADADPTGFGRAFCEESARNLQAAAARAMRTFGRRER